MGACALDRGSSVRPCFHEAFSSSGAGDSPERAALRVVVNACIASAYASSRRRRRCASLRKRRTTRARVVPMSVATCSSSMPVLARSSVAQSRQGHVRAWRRQRSGTMRGRPGQASLRRWGPQRFAATNFWQPGQRRSGFLICTSKARARVRYQHLRFSGGRAPGAVSWGRHLSRAAPPGTADGHASLAGRRRWLLRDGQGKRAKVRPKGGRVERRRTGDGLATDFDTTKGLFFSPGDRGDTLYRGDWLLEGSSRGPSRLSSSG